MILSAALGAVMGVLSGPALLVVARRFQGVRATRRRALTVSAVAGLVCAALCVRLIPDPQARFALPAFLFLTLAGFVLALIDVDTHRLPDAVTLPGYPVLVVMLTVASGLAADWTALVRGMVSAAVALGLYGALWLVAPQGLGLGDVKLAGLLALALGWLSLPTAVAGAVFGLAVGAGVALALVAFGRATPRTEVAFGPALLIGGLAGVLAGDPIVAFYLAV